MAYIDAESLKRKLIDEKSFYPAIVARALEEMPAADVVEVKRGEWTHTDKADRWHSKDECSECHYHTFDRIDLTHFNYCPNCGAKMDGQL